MIHHMPKTGWSGRLTPWAHIGTIGVGLLLSLTGVLRGNTETAVVGGGLAVLTAWLLIRRLRLEQRPQPPAQMWTFAFRFLIGSSVVAIGLAVLATLSAAQASGGTRILYAVIAGLLFEIGAVTALSTVAIHMFRRAYRRGCAYCADDTHMNVGHLEQPAGSETRKEILLRCPKCGWLYEVSPLEPREVVHIADTEVATRLLN